MALAVPPILSDIPLPALRSYEGVLESRPQPGGHPEGRLGAPIRCSRGKATRPPASRRSSLMSPSLPRFLSVSASYNWM